MAEELFRRIELDTYNRVSELLAEIQYMSYDVPFVIEDNIPYWKSPADQAIWTIILMKLEK